MSERKSWGEVKAARADTKARRAGYAEAREASWVAGYGPNGNASG